MGFQTGGVSEADTWCGNKNYVDETASGSSKWRGRKPRAGAAHHFAAPSPQRHVPLAEATVGTPGSLGHQGGEVDPPLFGPGARRVMDGWRLRAPLLHGSQPERPATDPGSSASIPREVVQEEVRRQVQEALESQRKHMQELIEENRRLRDGAASQDRQRGAVLVDHMTVGYLYLREYLRGVGLLVSSTMRAYLKLIHLVFEKDLEYLRGIGLLVSSTVLTVYLRLDPPGVREGLGVPQGHRAFRSGLQGQVLPGTDPTGVRDGLGVPQGHRAFDQGYSSGLPGSRSNWCS